VTQVVTPPLPEGRTGKIHPLAKAGGGSWRDSEQPQTLSCAACLLPCEYHGELVTAAGG